MNTTRTIKKNMLRICTITAIFVFILNIQFIDVSLGQTEEDEIEKNTYRDAFPLQTYDSRFYILYLNQSDTMYINITAAFSGDFDIIVFNKRPTDIGVGSTGYWIDFDHPSTIAYDIGEGDVVNFQFTAPNNGMYYIQVVLIANGTDTYYLTSLAKNSTGDYYLNSLELYFIPFILPGFPLEVTLVFSLFAIFALWQFIIKKRLFIHK